MKAQSRRFSYFSLFSLLAMLILAACGNTNGSTGSTSGNTGNNSGQPTTVRLAYFPNLTHAVALVGTGKGTFKQALGENVTLETKTFNAGPSLVEALFAGNIDIGYIGPNPAINGFVKSKGEALRIIAGSSSGGALFIAHPNANIKSAQDLNGKKLATPQLGGTQDIALRYYLQQNGLKTVDKGGTVQVVPTQNADILTLFKQGQLDGAWVPEPWASRLILEAKGQVFLDERTIWPEQKFVTTLVIVSKKFLDQHPDLVEKFLAAHIETVQFINNDRENAKTFINEELKKLTGKALDTGVLDNAFKNLDITYDPLTSTIYKSADDAYELGFLGTSKPDLNGIVELQQLNTVLAAKGLTPIAV